MFVPRVARVVNSGKVVRSRSRATKPKGKACKSSGNPIGAYLMTLGSMNPKKGSTMAKKKTKKKKSTAHRATVARGKNHKTRGTKKRGTTMTANSIRALMKRAKSGKRKPNRGSRNPMATTISLNRPSKVVEAGVGVLLGVAVTKGLVAALPANVTNSPLYSSVAAAGVALAIWWGGSMVSPEFGAALGIGGIAEAGSIALNGFLPDVGAKLALNGVGDFVPGRFTVPQNPVLDAATGLPNNQVRAISAYPKAYQTA